ncbi:putative reverse transcriptase domain-containing protein [Tanacetum coccineum]
MTREVVNELIERRVAEVLEARDAARNLEPLVEGGGEQGGENGDDYEGGSGGGKGNGGNGNDGGNDNENDNRNGNGNKGGNGHNFGGLMPVARECTYQDFLKCQALNFNGMEGVVGLTRWFEKMEMVFHISLPDNIQWNVIAAEPTRLQDAIRVANNLIDQKLKGYARNAENKRRPRHFKKDCLKLRHQNHGNKTGKKTGNKTRSNEAIAKAYAIGGGANLDSNFITGHPFDIDLMPIELGSFNVIIGMDWLAKYHAVIVCDEKIVRIPYGDEVLIIRGDDYDGGSKSKPNYHILYEDLEEFPKVFLEDFPGLPPVRQVEFQIDLVLSATPVARASYRLAPAEMQEFYTQVREEDTPKMAFRTRYGHYEFQVMPFGLTNAPASIKEHEGHLKLIIKLLKEEELYAKFSKCDFWLSRVQFLHVIDRECIHVDPAKIESIKDWASPKTPTEIHQFLGLSSYYQRFIEGFLKIARPMMKLTQKSVKFDSEEKAKAAFQLLK